MEEFTNKALQYVVAVLRSKKCEDRYCGVQARCFESDEPVHHTTGPHWLVIARAILQAFARELGVGEPDIAGELKWYHGTSPKTGKYRIWAMVSIVWPGGEMDILAMFLVDNETIQIQQTLCGFKKLDMNGIAMFASNKPPTGKEDDR